MRWGGGISGASASSRSRLPCCAYHGRRIVGEDAGHGLQIADVAVDHAEEREDEGNNPRRNKVHIKGSSYCERARSLCAFALLFAFAMTK